MKQRKMSCLVTDQQSRITPASSSHGQCYSSRVGRNNGVRGVFTFPTISENNIHEYNIQ